jgi:hypothetical protein
MQLDSWLIYGLCVDLFANTVDLNSRLLFIESMRYVGDWLGIQQRAWYISIDELTCGLGLIQMCLHINHKN